MNPRRKRGPGSLPAAAACLAVAALALTLPAVPGCNRADTPPASGGNRGAGEAAAAAAREKFLEQYKLTGRVALIEFGLFDCVLSDKGLEEMAFLHAQEAIPHLAYARVEATADVAGADEYYKAKALKLPVHRDPQTTVAQAFDGTAYPTFVIVGKFGRVRYRGKQPDYRLDDWVKALAAEQADPGPDVALLGVVKLDVPKLLGETRLPSLGGRAEPLASLMGAEGMLALFVDTNCPYSRQAMGDMAMVSGVLSRRKINSVLVNMGDPEAKVRKHYSQRAIGSATLVYDVATVVKDNWNVHSVPRVIFIGPDRKIVYNGKALWNEVATAIQDARGYRPGTIRFTAKGTKFG